MFPISRYLGEMSLTFNLTSPTLAPSLFRLAGQLEDVNFQMPSLLKARASFCIILLREKPSCEYLLMHVPG